MLESFWKLLTDYVLRPQVDAEQVDEHLRCAHASLPKPVIWLLGKTQAGKSSIIHAMTGSSLAAIGNGFRPCTRTTRLFEFPNEQECFLRFLDTRGLGEAGYDPTEDLAFCQNQAHLVMAVVRVMDMAQADVQDSLRKIRKAKPNWPVILVQTSLHDGYTRGATHLLPYPFEDEPWPDIVPKDLARSLAHQRKEFADLATSVVAVDFTLPEDGFSPTLYGMESLWSAIERELPLGLRDMLMQQKALNGGLADVYYQTAWPHIVSYSLASGMVGAVPIPFINVSAVLSMQAKMFHTIASIYKQPLDAHVMGELAAAIGTGFLVRLFGRSLLAMIPFVGTAAAGVFTAASTYSLGCTLCWYYSQVKQGIIPDASKMNEVFKIELEVGRQRFDEYLKKSEPSQPSEQTSAAREKT